jgi:hypothetical protein
MSRIRDQYPQVPVHRQVLDSWIRIFIYNLLVQIRVQQSIFGKPVGKDPGNSRVHSCNALAADEALIMFDIGLCCLCSFILIRCLLAPAGRDVAPCRIYCDVINI